MRIFWNGSSNSFDVILSRQSEFEELDEDIKQLKQAEANLDEK